MFQALFKRAEATVDHVVANLLARTLVAVPFLAAIGFATASATIYLNNELGPQYGFLVMAGVFLFVGVVGAAILASRSASQPDATQASDDASAVATEAGTTPDATASAAEREMLMSAVTAIGPLAVPAIARLAIRNLPLIAAIAAAGFVFFRSNPADPSDLATPMEPAE